MHVDNLAYDWRCLQERLLEYAVASITNDPDLESKKDKAVKYIEDFVRDVNALSFKDKERLSMNVGGLHLGMLEKALDGSS